MASKKNVFSLFISIVMIIVMIPVNSFADIGFERTVECVIDNNCSEIVVEFDYFEGLDNFTFLVDKGATYSYIRYQKEAYTWCYKITIRARDGVTFKDDPVTLSIITPDFFDTILRINGYTSLDFVSLTELSFQFDIPTRFANHAEVSLNLYGESISSCVANDLLVSYTNCVQASYMDDIFGYTNGFVSIIDVRCEDSNTFLDERNYEITAFSDSDRLTKSNCKIVNITYDYCGFPVDENTKDTDFMQLFINQGTKDLNEDDFTELKSYLIKNYDSNNDEIISFTEAIKVKEIHLTGITGAGDRYCDSKGVYHYIDNEYASTNYCKKPVYDLFPNLEKFSYSFPPELYSEEGVAGFVERLYVYVLERDSDPLGKLSWITAAENGATGADLATGFLFSEEFLNKPYRYDDFVKILYRVFFDRSADALGLNGWVEALEAGMSKTEVVAGFINSTEWANMCLSYGIKPGGVGDATIEIDPSDEIGQFVNRLYENCLGRQPDEEGFSRWKSDLANMRITGAQAALGFVFSPEFINSGFSNEEYITILYNTFLDREPSSLELSGWVTSLNSGETREKVLDGFIYSIEFGRICNQYGIAIY